MAWQDIRGSMASPRWFGIVDEFKDYGADDKMIVDDLIRAMSEEEAESNFCYLGQTYELSIPRCEMVEGGKYYVRPSESANKGF